jgi:hypothetical protein
MSTIAYGKQETYLRVYGQKGTLIMKVRISIEQTVDIDQAMSNDIGFEMFGPENMSNEDKVDYLVARFAEDIDTLVKYDEVKNNIQVEYIGDPNANV